MEHWHYRNMLSLHVSEVQTIQIRFEHLKLLLRTPTFLKTKYIS